MNHATFEVKTFDTSASSQSEVAGMVRDPRIRVSNLQSHQHSEWDAYVAAHPAATFFHQTGWMKVVQDQYGHRSCSLRAEVDGRLGGVLPLSLVAGPLTGRALISSPYAVTGGCVSETPAIESALLTEARRQATHLGVRYLEVRNQTADATFATRDHYYGFQTTLPTDPTQVLGRFPRKARAEIRKAQTQFQLTARFGHDLFTVFHDLYVRSLRRLGSPGHSRRFLRRLLTEFGENCVVQVVYRDQQPAAGVLSFRFRDQILPYYAGIDDRFNQFNSSNFLYYSLMEHAVTLELRVFDFGRTRRDNIGGCQFKINQGFEPRPMTYSFFSPQGVEPPDLRPSNEAFSWVRRAWRRLPLPVADQLGGAVSRWIP